jgi:N-acylglucosamine 2-epimerase
MQSLNRHDHEAEMKSALERLGRGESGPMAAWLRVHFLEHVMPFWEPLFDEEHGGLFTCVTDDGKVVSKDKWLWSQWRAVWVCARIFNTIEPDPKWRERALRIANFCCEHGWLEHEAGWALLLSGEGQLKRSYESIYVDAFAVYGMSELARATADRTWTERASATAAAACRRIDEMGDQLPHFPYQIRPDTKPHGIPMIWSLKLASLGAASGDPQWHTRSGQMLREIDQDFYHAGEDRVRETVWRDPATLRPEVVSATVPGHVIEGLWFRRVAECGGVGEVSPPAETWRRVMRHLELGWDHREGGGLLLAVDAAGDVAAEGWPLPDLKLWWPHTEALVAVLMASQETQESSWLEWYRRLWLFAAEHFVDWEHGEWRQKLDRDLSPFSGTVALPVKDPFHLPRSLIMQIETLESGEIPRP